MAANLTGADPSESVFLGFSTTRCEKEGRIAGRLRVKSLPGIKRPN